MARVIDFNKFEQPTLDVVLKDENQTKITVIAPAEALIEKLESNLDSIQSICKGATGPALDESFALAAELMSCNREGLTITGKELREKYKINYVMLFAFIAAYIDFIDEIKHAKN